MLTRALMEPSPGRQRGGDVRAEGGRGLRGLLSSPPRPGGVGGAFYYHVTRPFSRRGRPLPAHPLPAPTTEARGAPATANRLVAAPRARPLGELLSARDRRLQDARRGQGLPPAALPCGGPGGDGETASAAPSPLDGERHLAGASARAALVTARPSLVTLTPWWPLPRHGDGPHRVPEP